MNTPFLCYKDGQVVRHKFGDGELVVTYRVHRREGWIVSSYFSFMGKRYIFPDKSFAMTIPCELIRRTIIQDNKRKLLTYVTATNNVLSGQIDQCHKLVKLLENMSPDNTRKE